MRDTMRFLGGGALVSAAVLWKLKGPQWGVVAELGPFPDLTKGDLAGLPVAVAGLVVLGAVPGAGVARRTLGVSSLVAAILWVSSEWPWDDPLIPGLRWGRHGVHLLDGLAVLPLAVAVAVLRPRHVGRAPT